MTMRDASLAKLLAARPPWRSSFLTQVSQEAQDLDAVSALYSALSESSAPPLTEELRPFLDRLIRTGQVEQAYLVWMQSLPPERLSRLGYLYNAGFEYPVSNLPFDWVFARVDSAMVELSSETVRRSCKSGLLAAEFRSHWYPTSSPCPPGTYRFTGREQSDSLANERGLRWRIFCLEQPDGSLMETPPLLGDTPWRTFAVTFEVTVDCPVQNLQLELPARVALEQEVSGAASFADLSIAKTLICGFAATAHGNSRAAEPLAIASGLEALNVIQTSPSWSVPMRNLTWIICALAFPGAAFAEDVSTPTRCETQAKSTCAPASSARLTSANGYRAFVAWRWFRGGQVGRVARCRRSSAGEAGLGGCGLWPLLSDPARPEFDGDVSRERRRALCSAALIGPERRGGGSAE